ncbi:MAG: ABC transporter permease [Acidobacteria bacterium]|nr:ABC transporter permease [Acidobacteriota bacterium]
MKLSRSLLLSAEILAAHKLRTFLSILGIVVGVGTVTVMTAAGRGAQAQVLARIAGMGTDLLIVNAGKTAIVAGRQRQMDTVRSLSVADARAIAEECPSVLLAAPAVSRKLPLRREDRDAVSTVIGTSADGLDIRNIRVRSGRAFDAEEARAVRRVALLGPTAAANLFDGEDPLGRQVRINRVPFEIIGVTEPQGMDINGFDQDDRVVVPLETALRRILNQDYVHAVYVRARSTAVIGQAEKEIEDLLRRRHRLGEKANDFTLQNQATLLAAEREATGALTLLVSTVAGITLLVGGVGILAVMLMSVRERSREIGLRRALGALRRDIRNQFLLESGILAGAGGAAGALGGLGVCRVATALGWWPVVISWPVTGLAFGFAFAVGIFFGFYPAVRAARQEPIRALRGH